MVQENPQVYQRFSCGFCHLEQFPADFIVAGNSAGIPKEFPADFNNSISREFYYCRKFRSSGHHLSFHHFLCSSTFTGVLFWSWKEWFSVCSSTINPSGSDFRGIEVSEDEISRLSSLWMPFDFVLPRLGVPFRDGD
ncbi:cleavage and polyadenylation specificity factor [Trifolium repens]|nr:cleavage and polyadenylation specificity factor [Trifolium repens]